MAKKRTPEQIVPEGPLARESLVTLRERLAGEEAMLGQQQMQVVDALARTRGALAIVDKLLAASEPGAGTEKPA